jgi:CHAT domain-containing protein/Tfp pilus assembly protein PilF
VYDNLGQYPQALEHYQQALVILREVGDRAGEGRTFNNIGGVYNKLGQYPQALEHYQQALVIRREVGDRVGEGTTLNNIGRVYDSLGQYSQALEQFQQALVILHEVGNRRGEGTTLNNIGLVYNNLGQYLQALEQYQQALVILREVGDRAGEGTVLNNIGGVYNNLGQYLQALEYYQQALVILREVGSRAGEGRTLNRAGEGRTLNNIGLVYDSLGQYPQALEQFQQALIIARQIGDRAGEGTTLNNIGLVYGNLGQYPQALEQFQQALIIARQIGNRAGEGTALNNISHLFNAQDQPELAIVFLKESVNTWESIRGELRTLSTEQQQSFTDTVAGSYRKLADLLFQENRVLEAQRVLDLLKVQELDEYLRDVQRSLRTQSGVDYWQPEERILALYQQAIEEGEELARLDEKDRTVGLTPQEEERYSELTVRQSEILSSFSAFIEYPEIQQAIAQLRQTTQEQNIEVAQLNSLQTDLRNLQQDAVLLYPLILEDRLELVLVTPYSPPIRRPVEISSIELNRLIVEMGQALKDPGSDARAIAQQLYEVLIKPLEADLAAAHTRTIIYAPDGALRYIPLAALHDGQQWLAQRYGITHITAASLTRFDDRPQANLRVLAAACAECSFNFNVGTQSFQFTDLPYTQTEVETLAALLPNTRTLINQAFSPTELQALMRRYSVVHLATHAAFVQGQADQSFIVFGNGDKVPLSQIRTEWNLPNTDLVVLSACETAVGEAQLGSGVEILGFGYQMQQTGARAAIASLWQVSDGGTQVLMNAFYAGLERGMTKAEALRQAQIALITGDFTAVGGDRGTINIISTRTGLSQDVSDRLDHPYYWAPFILIGNGL